MQRTQAVLDSREAQKGMQGKGEEGSKSQMQVPQIRCGSLTTFSALIQNRVREG